MPSRSALVLLLAMAAVDAVDAGPTAPSGAAQGVPPASATLAPSESSALDRVKHLRDFEVVELRRYTTTPGGRSAFARCFESFFPEAFQQIGSIAFGHFGERARPDGFTWLRGFHDMDARAAQLGAFYYGPLWREHKKTMNDLLVDSDDVLLLRPLHPERGVLVLPAVDPVREEKGAGGVVAAQIFAVKPEALASFAARAETELAAYARAGAREAGLLVTLDAPNNFPQLPVRTDGPYLVWLGVVPDEETLSRRLGPLAERTAGALEKGGLLRRAPEWVVLDPAPRSRLRWLPEWSAEPEGATH